LLVEPDKVIGQATAIAGQLAKLPRHAYAYQKSAMRKPALDAIRASIGNHPNLRNERS